MNLWRQLESKVTNCTPEHNRPEQRQSWGARLRNVLAVKDGRADDGKSSASPSLGPRIDVALEVSAVATRFILDPRISFGLAIGALIFVPTLDGRILAAGLVALGCILLYRADRWGRIPDHLRWLAWADLNKPLLRRLSLEAPGTYAHTIAIANLCETACNAIGARGLLARVGAYYHDIGKLRKPQHFVENQVRGRNPHDKLKPSTSAAIIRNHVREGIELAEEYRVPREIRAFIAQHHGTIHIAFFLEKARERDGSVNSADFTYPGPIPQTIETAVCMLADGVEARMRSLHDPTPAAIGDAVDAIIQRRLEEGQLRDAPITLRQLTIVRDQFVRILTGMHHGRVEYPTSAGNTLTITPSSRVSA